jgi:hypothetical protein
MGINYNPYPTHSGRVSMGVPMGQIAGLRASPAVEGLQAEIRRYLAPDGCKFRPGEAHVSSDEKRTK